MSLLAGVNGASRQLGIGAVVLFTLSAAANLASPLYPVYQQTYAMSDWTMTALYAVYVISCLPSLLLFGSAADTFGRRPVLLAAIACVGLGTLMFALGSVGTSGLFAGRVLLGIGLGLGTGAGIALMVEASPAHRPWLGSTTATVSFVLGAGAGPIFAGTLAEITGGALTAPFIAMLGLLAINAAVVLALRLHRPVARQRWRPARPSVPGPMRPSFNIAAVTGFLGWVALGLFLALLPSMAASALPGSNTLTAGMIVGSVLIISATSQLVAPMLEPRAAQTIGLSLLGLGAALLLSSNLSGLGASTALTLMAIAAITTGAGHGLSYWGANREVDILAPSSHRAGITAALHLAFYAGAGLPAISVGVIAMGTPLIEAIMIVTLILLLATIAFIPIPSLALTTIRRPRITHVDASIISGSPTGERASADWSRDAAVGTEEVRAGDSSATRTPMMSS